MAKFSNDADILKYDPILFGELHLPGQVLAGGNDGILSGTTLTAATADFVAAGVEAGGVVYLKSTEGALDGAYEIVSVDSGTQLTVSVVRSDAADPAIAPPVTGDVSYRISTFGPQASEVAFRLTEFFGVQPGNPASEIAVQDIVDTGGLRRASVLAIISCVYEMWANGTQEECHWQKSLLYRQLSEQAKLRCHLSVDLDADGVIDITRVGGAIRLVRD